MTTPVPPHRHTPSSLAFGLFAPSLRRFKRALAVWCAVAVPSVGTILLVRHLGGDALANITANVIGIAGILAAPIIAQRSR